MPRKNNRRTIQEAGIKIPGYRRVIEDSGAKNLGAIDNAATRARYQETSLGRPLVQGAAQSLVLNTFGRPLASKLRMIPESGVVYLPGTLLAKITNYGDMQGEKRLSPAKSVANLAETIEFKNSAANPVEVPILSLAVKEAGRYTLNIVARMGDVPTKGEYETEGLILGEKVAAIDEYDPTPINRHKPLSQISHFVVFASAQSEDATRMREALLAKPIPAGTYIALGPVGPVHTPRK